MEPSEKVKETLREKQKKGKERGMSREREREIEVDRQCCDLRLTRLDLLDQTSTKLLSFFLPLCFFVTHSLTLAVLCTSPNNLPRVRVMLSRDYYFRGGGYSGLIYSQLKHKLLMITSETSGPV